MLAMLFYRRYCERNVTSSTVAKLKRQLERSNILRLSDNRAKYGVNLPKTKRKEEGAF